MRARKGGGFSTITHQDVLAFAPVALLIVDEFSMVAIEFLLDLSSRLMALKANDITFGAVSLCLNGDIFQARDIHICITAIYSRVFSTPDPISCHSLM